MKMHRVTVGWIVLSAALLCVAAAPAFADCQATTSIYTTNNLPYPAVNHFGGVFFATAWSPMPPIDGCDPEMWVGASDDWLWQDGTNFDYFASFSIEVFRNRNASRSGEINIEFWLREHEAPWDHYRAGSAAIGVSQETGAPSSLVVDPDQILIPPNRTVTFVTDMTEFFVELKYRYRTDPQQQWSSELTTPTYYVDYRGFWTLDYTSNEVACCSGYYEFTSIRDSDEGSWQAISVPVYLGPSEESAENVGLAESVSRAFKMFLWGVSCIRYAPGIDAKDRWSQNAMDFGEAGERTADTRRYHRGEAPRLGTRSRTVPR
jgi:hypothetical protein